MKKLILPLLFLLTGGITVNGQTTATDFTATDCSSTSHTLFTELDGGKVVVLVWVMPCATCISDAKAAYDAVQSFATSNPGKVLYWMSDDAGNTSCTSLNSWASTNAIGPTNLVTFGNSGNTINEANYGGTGMPHVVVMGNNTHHIFYNQKNGSNDGVAITAAINSALATTGVTNISGAGNSIQLFPNPVKDRATLNYTLDQQSVVSIDVYNIIGNKVKTIVPGIQNSGEHTIDLNFDSKPANGIYFIKLNAGNSSQTIKFTVAD